MNGLMSFQFLPVILRQIGRRYFFGGSVLMTELMFSPNANSGLRERPPGSADISETQNQPLLSRQLFPHMAALGELVRLAIVATGNNNTSLYYVRMRIIPPLQLNQYRLYYSSTALVGAIMWALFDDQTEARYLSNNFQLVENDWKSGDKIWITDILAPSGHEDKMIANLKSTVFRDKRIHVPTLDRDQFTTMTV
jgi:cytolysin-activating lysine-acyltransferase